MLTSEGQLYEDALRRNIAFFYCYVPHVCRDDLVVGLGAVRCRPRKFGGWCVTLHPFQGSRRTAWAIVPRECSTTFSGSALPRPSGRGTSRAGEPPLAFANRTGPSSRLRHVRATPYRRVAGPGEFVVLFRVFPPAVAPAPRRVALPFPFLYCIFLIPDKPAIIEKKEYGSDSKTEGRPEVRFPGKIPPASPQGKELEHPG